MSPLFGKRCWFWCWIPCILLLILLLWCWRFRPCADSFHADLVIEDETTVAWATTNNIFAGGTPDPTDTHPYWTGILFQLGAADMALQTFNTIQFYKGGSKKGELQWDKVAWVNIVADGTGLDDPMLVTDFHLIDGECEVREGCNHCKRLHARLDPTTVMTYWQGPGGFAVEANQKIGPFNVNNEQRFDFKDNFKITCYQKKDGGDLEEIAGYVFGVGQIDEIRVTWVPSGPGGGVKQDPPWPGP